MSTCNVCQRDPKRANSEFAECSHIQCPHRRTAWSERPSRAELFRGPWPKPEPEADPAPLDRVENLRRVRMAGREVVHTGKVAIGCAYLPPPAPMFSHAERLQRALLEPRTAQARPMWALLLGRLWSWC